MSEETTKKSLFKKKEKPKKTVKQEIISWILNLGAAVILALLIRNFLFTPVRVDGHSMENTLMDKEIVLAWKPGYLKGEINRRDIVICHYPDRGSTLFVKRLVGLPGDTIEIKSGILFVNGELINESDIDMSTWYPDNMAARTLGEDEYFVMGDNRGNSNDSRAVGALPRSYILGHVTRVLYPFDQFWDKVE